MGRGSGASAVKLYYRIGEVAGLVGVEPHVLRYWESEFPSIRPQKSRSGQRVYSRRDVDKLLRVKELLYNQRFTIAGARQRLRDPGSDIPSASAPDAEAVQEASSAQVRIAAPVEASTEGLRSSAQTLRATLLAARREVCQLLESFHPAADRAGGAPDGFDDAGVDEGETVLAGTSRAPREVLRTEHEC